jgi:hypothetical protein
LIPGAAISAHSVGTGIVNETVTNETGTYQFSNLQTGTYEVKAELPGFQTQRITNVILGVGQQVRLNFTLTVAAVATTVEVTTVADTALATTSGSIATVLPDSQVRELRLGDRNVLALLSGMAGTGATRSLGLNLDKRGHDSIQDGSEDFLNLGIRIHFTRQGFLNVCLRPRT